MSAAKHTPGPWFADKIEDRAAYNIVTPGRSSALLTLEPGKHDGADPRVATVEADARLIAAAPDLLAALKAIVDEQDERQGYASYEAYDKARAAIAKAKGAAQ